MRELDSTVHSRLLELLSAQSPITDRLVQEAALNATTVLVQRCFAPENFAMNFANALSSFPNIAPVMSSHLRRFVTSPLPIFEFEFASGQQVPTALAAAAKCLALCIKVNCTI